MAVIFDPRMTGVRDDGSEQGVVSTEDVGGGLVPVAFWRGGYFSEASAGSAVNYQSGGAQENTDGSNCAIYISILAGGSGAIWFTFYGRTLGIRHRAATTAFEVTVDGGVPVPVPRVQTYVAIEGHEPTGNYEVRYVTHRDLGAGIHLGRIAFTGPASGMILGLLLERSEGYLPPTRTGQPSDSSAAAVPTVATAFAPTSGLGASSPLRYISKAVYSNPTAAPIDLTWTQSSDGAVCLFKSIAPGETYALDFGLPLVCTGLKQRASGAGLVALFVGGNH